MNLISEELVLSKWYSYSKIMTQRSVNLFFMAQVYCLRSMVHHSSTTRTHTNTFTITTTLKFVRIRPIYINHVTYYGKFTYTDLCNTLYTLYLLLSLSYR